MQQLMTREHPSTLTRAEPVRATSWDPATRTFTVVLSAGAAVARADARGTFDEVLDLAGAVIPDRVPLLDSHVRGSVDAQLGEVTNIRLEGGRLIGTGRLSQHNPRAQRIAAELSDGAAFGVSIGYDPKNWAERINPTTQRRERIATAFDLQEASLVSVPADPAAGIRSAPGFTTGAAPSLDRASVNGEIRSIARAANLDQAFVDRMIDANVTADFARAAAFEAMQSRSAGAASVRSAHNTSSLDNPEVRVRAIGEALFARQAVGHQLSEPARQFTGMTTLDIARECLRAAGVHTTALTPSSVVERALMSTSDFPNVFADTLGRTLRQSYQAAPSGIRQLARQTTVRDFRTKTSISVSSDIKLEKVNEHGEYKSGAMIDAKEAYRIYTFGKIIGLTTEMLVNDDLGAFGDVASRMGQAAAAFEAEHLVKMIIANPIMDDGKALFHGDHGNLRASVSPILGTALSDARLALRRQTDDGGNLISITPAFLVVGPELETEAEQTLAEISPTAVDDVNVFAGKLKLIVEPRLAGAQWYVVASPAEVPSLEYAYLEGEPGPQVAQEVGFDYDGVRFRIRERFGAGWVDWRGWYKVPA